MAGVPLGRIAGYTLVQDNGSSGYIQTRGDAEWTRASTRACVDRYVPSGEATSTVANNEGVFSRRLGAITPGDGELVIDRSTSPASYTMRGSTEDRLWAAQHGSFDGLLLAGGGLSSNIWVSWELTAEGAAFPPPDGCVGAAADRVTTGSQMDIQASATWTRVETAGCVDLYVPEGTAVHPSPPVPDWCESVTYSDTSGRITPDDYASLRIDRSTSPPRVHMSGSTFWQTDRTCTRADGSTETDRILIGGDWALVDMTFDGRRFGGALDVGGPPASWSFALPWPPETLSSGEAPDIISGS
jgi:hypothetical protein